MTHLVLPKMNTVQGRQSDLGAWCEYCTISTECSQGVTRDACEHYLLEFTDKILP
jgi:hypothetical protein